MRIRVLTDNNYLDLETIACDKEVLLDAISEGNAVAMQKKDGSIFILNTINVIGIEIIKEDIPPIEKR